MSTPIVIHGTFDGTNFIPKEPLPAVQGNADLIVYPGMQSAGSVPIRDHSAFLHAYSPEDEGLYDDHISR